MRFSQRKLGLTQEKDGGWQLIGFCSELQFNWLIHGAYTQKWGNINKPAEPINPMNWAGTLPAGTINLLSKVRILSLVIEFNYGKSPCLIGETWNQMDHFP